MAIPREAELRRVWTTRYGIEWNVYLYADDDYMRWSVRPDRQSPYDEIGAVDVRPETLRCGNKVELVWIWVDEQYRRQQLGLVLLSDVVDWCREQDYNRIYGKILNESAANFKGLKRFYEKGGFVVSFNEERSIRMGNNNATFKQILGDG